MKTLVQNINSLLSVLFAAKALIYKNSIINHLIEINYTKYFAGFTGLLNNPGRYLLPLSNMVIKEAMGYDLEIGLLLGLFGAYLLQAKNALVNNALINKLKGLNNISYHNPERGLTLIS